MHYVEYGNFSAGLLVCQELIPSRWWVGEYLSWDCKTAGSQFFHGYFQRL